MAPRRSVKTVCATNNNNNYNNLTFNDVLCPICRSILIEPVTLPCNHGFCSACFEGTVANANLVCPLCRVRIGSWIRRSSKKDNKLINIVLWEAIQKNFPKQVKNKLEGIEEYPEEDTPRRLTVAGEIRREYEIQKAKELQELHMQREAEDKASEDYIRKLKDQEEYEKCVQDENLRLSEQVAKKLAQEYSFDPGPSSSKVESKVNSLASCSYKKQLPIDGLLKNLSRKKLSVTVQSVSENLVTAKEYTCKVLCQDRNKELSNQNSTFDKAAMLNWKVHDKLKKIVTEGEASDSNDSITSECRYFKPIDSRHIPIPMKIPVIKVPAIIATANTVIIGPPKGEATFRHATVGSAFAVVSILAFPFVIPQNETVTKTYIVPPKRKILELGSTCDTVVADVVLPVKELPSSSTNIRSPKRHTRNKTQTEEALLTSPSIIKKYETRNKSNQKSSSKTPEKNSNLYREFATFTTPSKRKRLRSTPLAEKVVSPKRTRITITNATCSPPFHGFDNKNVSKLKGKNNGAFLIESADVHNVNSKFNNGDINNLKKLQEEEDFKFAQKLQEELNNRGRYSTRNSISVKTKNVRKPSTRQVTLKEMISQTASKVP